MPIIRWTTCFTKHLSPANAYWSPRERQSWAPLARIHWRKTNHFATSKGQKNNNKTEQRTQLLLLPCFVFFVFFEEDENSNKKIDIISNKLIPFKKYIFIPANGSPKTALLWQNRPFQFFDVSILCLCVALPCRLARNNYGTMANNDRRPRSASQAERCATLWEEEKIRICDTAHIEGAVWSPYHPA